MSYWLAAVAGVVVFEAVAVPSQNDPGVSLLRLPVGGQRISLAEVLLIGGALIYFVRERRRVQLRLPAVLWILFLAWYASAGFRGALAGHRLSVVAFEGRALVTLGVPILVLATLRGDALFSSRRAQLFGAYLLAPGVALWCVAVGRHILGLPIPAAGVVPLLGSVNLSAFGADGATAISVVGTCLAAVALGGNRPRWRLVFGGGVLMASAVLADQRGAFLASLGSGAVIVGAVLANSEWRPDVLAAARQIPRGYVVAVCLATVGAILVAGPWQLAAGLHEQYVSTFASTAKAESANSRVLQQESAVKDITARPLMGWGLGREYVRFEPGPNTYLVTDVYHNTALDIGVRTGAIGLSLFCVAVGATLIASLRASLEAGTRTHVAGPILGAGASLIGLMLRSGVESLLEKYRLTLLAGLLLGSLLSLHCSRGVRAGAVSSEKEDT
ncbi:MAG: O-antigen ligase family protein [Thermoleophilia bacterium]